MCRQLIHAFLAMSLFVSYGLADEVSESAVPSQQPPAPAALAADTAGSETPPPEGEKPEPAIPTVEHSPQKSPVDVLPDGEIAKARDIRVIDTSRFELRVRYGLSEVSVEEAEKIITEAAQYVESRFPGFKSFETIHHSYVVVISVEPAMRALSADDASARRDGQCRLRGGLLGDCRLASDEILIRVSAESLRDRETVVHELVHAMLYGNDTGTCHFLHEGIARYIEDRQGQGMAVRNLLIERGVPPKEVAGNLPNDCYYAAIGYVSVRYMAEFKNKSLEEIARLPWSDVPEPREAFGAVAWSSPPSKESIAPTETVPPLAKN